MTPEAIAAIPLACGNRQLRVDEVFEVAPAAGEALIIRNQRCPARSCRQRHDDAASSSSKAMPAPMRGSP